MKYTHLLPLAVATAATAFLIPSDAMSQQLLALGEEEEDYSYPVTSPPSSFATQQEAAEGLEPWWDEIPDRETLLSSIEAFMDVSIDATWSTIDAAVESASRHGHSAAEKVSSVLFSASSPDSPDSSAPAKPDPLPQEDVQGGCTGHHGPGRHIHCDKTLYEMIQESKYSTRFAKIIDEFDDIKERLQSTKANYTVFVPTDKAIERLHKHHGGGDHEGKKPSREFVEQVLEYHFLPGVWPAHRVLHAHTLPSELVLEELGGHRQRLRVSAGIFGVRLNFYAKVVATDIFGTNGVIHALDAVLVPPPRQGKLVGAFPSRFSTFLLALERTKLGEELHSAPQRGGTLFVPSNAAFVKLGPRLNAFLFSEPGLKYLSALLKYHVVANQTLYSDAFYGPGKEKDARRDHGHGDAVSTAADKPHHGGSWHVDLPTLLKDKSLSVDVRRFLGITHIVVNRWVHVGNKDGVSRDGVVHVVNSVLIPPHKKKEGDALQPEQYENDQLSVEELKELLSPYVGGEDVTDGFLGDL